MNRRRNVTASFARGEDFAYLIAIGVEGVTRVGANRVEILLREDVATRTTAFHEWLHFRLTVRAGGFSDGRQDQRIEAFLARHRRIRRLDG